MTAGFIQEGMPCVAYTLKELGDNANEQLIKEVKLSEELHEMNLLIKSIIKNKSIIAFGE